MLIRYFAHVFGVILLFVTIILSMEYLFRAIPYVMVPLFVIFIVRLFYYVVFREAFDNFNAHYVDKTRFKKDA